MENKNTDLQTVNNAQGHLVRKDSNGNFKRIMEYKEYISKVPQTDEETIELFNIIKGLVPMTPFKQLIGKEINVDKIYMLPYDSINQETGELKKDVKLVLTYQGEKGIERYVTSSKTAFNTIKDLVKAIPPYEYSYILKIIETDNPKSSRKLIDLQLIKMIKK